MIWSLKGWDFVSVFLSGCAGFKGFIELVSYIGRGDGVSAVYFYFYRAEIRVIIVEFIFGDLRSFEGVLFCRGKE